MRIVLLLAGLAVAVPIVVAQGVFWPIVLIAIALLAGRALANRRRHQLSRRARRFHSLYAGRD